MKLMGKLRSSKMCACRDCGNPPKSHGQIRQQEKRETAQERADRWAELNKRYIHANHG